MAGGSGLSTHITSILLWTFLPSLLTSFTLSLFYRLFPRVRPTVTPRSSPAQVGAANARAESHHRRARVALLSAYFAYSIASVFWAQGRPAQANYYALLGLPREVVEADGAAAVKKHWKKLARVYHPDKVGSSGEALFVEMKKAVDVLQDEGKRWAYERFGPGVTSWGGGKLVTHREFLKTGVMHAVVFWGSVFLSIVALTFFRKGERRYNFWRYLSLFLTLSLEFHFLLRPYPSPTFSLLFPSRLTYQHISLLRQIFISSSMAMSQIAPMLFPPSRSTSPDETEDPLARAVADAEQLKPLLVRLTQLVATAEAEASAMQALELRPLLPSSSSPASDPPVVSAAEDRAVRAQVQEKMVRTFEDLQIKSGAGTAKVWRDAVVQEKGKKGKEKGRKNGKGEEGKKKRRKKKVAPAEGEKLEANGDAQSTPLSTSSSSDGASSPAADPPVLDTATIPPPVTSLASPPTSPQVGFPNAAIPLPEVVELEAVVKEESAGGKEAKEAAEGKKEDDHRLPTPPPDPSFDSLLSTPPSPRGRPPTKFDDLDGLEKREAETSPSSPPLVSLASSSSSSTSTAAELSSPGSGSPPYRTSPSFLLFALTSLLLGLFLLTCGHRGWRAITALGCGLVLELVVWVVIANTLPAEGFSEKSQDSTGLIVWGLVTAGGLVGLVVGAFWWRVGVFAMGAVSGAALGLGVDMMGDNALPEVARWVVLGVLILAGIVVLPFFANSVGMIIATSLTGSFLLFLGVDLLVNENDGMSKGLRYILDGNSAHAEALSSYSPPVSTRVFLAVSWAVAVISMVLQWLFWVVHHRQPFIRQVVQLKAIDPTTTTEGTLPPDFASDYRLPTLPPGLSDEFSVRSPTPMGDDRASFSSQRDMQERYRLAVADPSPEPFIGDSRGTSPLLPMETIRKIEAIRHPRDLSHPEEPPSRPASIVSSAFAAGLRSRPPTFFDEPLRTPPLAPRSPPQRKPTPPFPAPPPVETALPPNPSAVLSSPTASTFVTQNIPIVAVPAVAVTRPPSSPRRPSIPTSVPVGPDSEDGASVTPPTSANRQTKSSGSLTVGGKAAAAFAAGMEAGEAISLPATARTPSSNEISTLLGGKFDTPSPALPLASSPPAQISYFAPLSPPGAPSTTGRPSTDGDDRSFATAESSTEYDAFPSTPTEVRALSPPASAVQGGRKTGRGGEDETEELW
ncbi:hypothetical protein JCM6882_007019 [Rhodosporidiobolus microsporus]